MRAKSVWQMIFWSGAVLMLVLSLMPTTPAMPTTGWDKSNHLLGFLVVTVLGLRGYPDRYRLVLAGLLCFGGLIEVLQSFTGYRFAEWGDWLADGCGVAAGFWLDRVLCRRGIPGKSRGA